MNKIKLFMGDNLETQVNEFVANKKIVDITLAPYNLNEVMIMVHYKEVN